MPLYYFNVLGDPTQDLVGTEFANADAARHDAIRTAGQILSDTAADIRDGVPWMMRVTDVAGGVVCNLRFSADSDPSVT